MMIVSQYNQVGRNGHEDHILTWKSKRVNLYATIYVRTSLKWVFFSSETFVCVKI